MSQLLEPREVATYYRVPEATLSQWRYLNKGPRWSKVGRHVRYRLEDVEAWLDDNTHGGTESRGHRAAVGRLETRGGAR